MGLLMLGFYKPVIPTASQKLVPAPSILLHSADGNIIDLQQQKGKVVFLNFWAVWCPPCLAELPTINKLYARTKNNPNILFLMVDVDNNLPRAAKMLAGRGYQLPGYGGSPASLPAPYFEQVIPTTIVINKKGFIVFNHVNSADYNDDKFVAYLLDLAKE